MEQNAQYLESTLSNPQLLAMALVQAMSRVLSDLVTPQRSEGPVVNSGRDNRNWIPMHWDRE
eukprot:6490269-Alexandrium_andersonii.AAC.1